MASSSQDPAAYIAAQWALLQSHISSYASNYYSNINIDPDSLPSRLQSYTGYYSHVWLSFEQPATFVIEKLVFTWLNHHIFSKYCFGLTEENNEELQHWEALLLAQESDTFASHWRQRVLTKVVAHRGHLAARNERVRLLVADFDAKILLHLSPAPPSTDCTAALFEIVYEAVKIHLAMRASIRRFDVVFLEKFWDGCSDQFEPQMMEKLGVMSLAGAGEGVLAAAEMQSAFRDQVRMRDRQWMKEEMKRRVEKREEERHLKRVGREAEERVEVVDESSLWAYELGPKRREDYILELMEERGAERVVLFVSPALLELEEGGEGLVLMKAAVFTAGF